VFDVRAHLVANRQRGVSYRQLIPTGFHGSVRRHAAFIPIDKEQARCMKREHARPLRGHRRRAPG
jgi:hypothetical protein